MSDPSVPDLPVPDLPVPDSPVPDSPVSDPPVRLASSLEGPAGAPVLVLGNSLGTTRAVWDPQVPALREHFRLLRYEHRGHGRPAGAAGISSPAASADPGQSPAPAGPYAIDELGRDVLGLLDAHGIERAAYCGISLGAMVGMWLAAHAPERIAGLGLCCTSAFLPPAAMWTARAEQVRCAGMASIAEPVVSRWFTPQFRDRCPSVPASFVDGLLGTDPQGYAGCCDAIAAMDLRPALGSITAPTLVIAGAQDPATPPWHGAVIASGIRNSALIVIRGASHLANVAAAGQVTSALLSHLLAVSL
jgi:3-oxoadipate enol-lactonase